jgi:hypothetical protein
VGKEDGVTNLADLFTKVLTADPRRRAWCRHIMYKFNDDMHLRRHFWTKTIFTSIFFSVSWKTRNENLNNLGREFGWEDYNFLWFPSFWEHFPEV